MAHQLNIASDLPLTAEKIDGSPETRREVLIALAHQGRAEYHALMAKIADCADFDRCRAGYTNCASLPALIKAHGRRLEVLAERAQELAGGATRLRRMGRRWAAKDPIFDELRLVTRQTNATVRALVAAWEIERARLLQQNELEGFRFARIVAALKEHRRAEGAAEETEPQNDAPVEETAAAA